MQQLPASSAVSHRLERARALAQYRGGQVRKEMLCDAPFVLIAASEFHGQAADYPCPICEGENVRVVYWIYGDELGKISSSARSVEEIDALASKGLSFTVHTVEVCPDCRWNHLLSEAIVAAR